VPLPVVPPVVGQMPPPPLPPDEGNESMYEQVPSASQVMLVALGSAGQSAELWQGLAQGLPVVLEVPVVPVVLLPMPQPPPMVPLFWPVM
jgi:hypothetical protein